MLKKPFYLGSLKLSSNIFCAPLAGCSDYAFRKMTSKYKPGLTFCEMVKMDGLVRPEGHNFQLLDYDADMHPIGAQLCGCKPKIAGEAAKMLEDLGFDVIDLNCGCPVDKVTKDGSGSAMLKTPGLIGEVLSTIVKSVKIPVTVKVRAGWNEENINIEQITRIAESAGAKIITVHGRTRAQGYSGTANRDWIKRAKDAAHDILVFGNGDIFDGPSAEAMFRETGCDGILLARGTMGKPWLIEEVERYLEGRPPLEITGAFLKEIFLEHYEHVVRHQSERLALLNMRRIGCWYLKGRKGAKELRNIINHSSSLSELKETLIAFSWDAFNASSEEVYAEC